MKNILRAISDIHSKKVHGRIENDRKTERRAIKGREREIKEAQTERKPRRRQ
jgi:hypothetical protein